MTDTLILIADERDAAMADDALIWVRFADGVAAAQGHDARWQDQLAAVAGRTLMIIPAATAPVRWRAFAGLPPAQAQAAAAYAALADRLGDRAGLHAAAQGADGDDMVAAAAVERTWLAGWLDRLRAAGADVAAAVPMAALIPAPADERALRSMAIGAAGAVRGAAHGFADDPALVLALGGGAAPDAMAAADVAAALAAAIDRPPLDMLTGPFRRRAKGAMTPGRRRLMAQ
ncbi:MAG: hypothetical protein RLZZ58_1406, partial [Pseudomonadota bacterium]